MASTQFARVESYSATSKTTIQGVLDEASRVPDACPHVQHPLPPNWLVGSRAEVETAIEAHMGSGAEVRLKNGTVAKRKRRSDHRSLVAGVLSHPLPMNDLRAAGNLMDRMTAMKRDTMVKKWRDDAVAWLRRQWGDKLVAVVEHRDESHPHLHFFVVGDAQRLHPGLRAELAEGGTRADKADATQRRTAHRAGLKAWLDEYHRQVGEPHGMERGDGSSRPVWRLANRQLRSKLHEFAQRIEAIEDAQERAKLQAEWIEQYDQAEHVERPRMRF